MCVCVVLANRTNCKLHPWIEYPNTKHHCYWRLPPFWRTSIINAHKFNLQVGNPTKQTLNCIEASVIVQNHLPPLSTPTLIQPNADPTALHLKGYKDIMAGQGRKEPSEDMFSHLYFSSVLTFPFGKLSISFGAAMEIVIRFLFATHPAAGVVR